MKALKVFREPFEAPQRSVKIQKCAVMFLKPTLLLCLVEIHKIGNIMCKYNYKYNYKHKYISFNGAAKLTLGQDGITH